MIHKQTNGTLFRSIYRKRPEHKTKKTIIEIIKNKFC